MLRFMECQTFLGYLILISLDLIANNSMNILCNNNRFKTTISKLATIVEGDQKAPFSIATTTMCRGGHYSFPWIAPLYSWYVPYIAEC